MNVVILVLIKLLYFRDKSVQRKVYIKQKKKNKWTNMDFWFLARIALLSYLLIIFLLLLQGVTVFLLEQKIQSNPLSLDRNHLSITYFVIGLRSFISEIASSNNDKQFVQD